MCEGARSTTASDELQPNDDVREFTIGLGDNAINVSTGYRNPVVERVEAA